MVSQLSYIAQTHWSKDSIAKSGLGYLPSVFNQDNLPHTWPQASLINQYFNRLSLKPVSKTTGRCSNYNFEESESKNCFHMVLRKYAFSDLIRMKWRLSIWTQVRGSETLLFSIVMLLQYFDYMSTVVSYSSIMYKWESVDSYTCWGWAEEQGTVPSDIGTCLTELDVLLD